jgi:PAS domain S-box-containing protein
MSWVTVVWLMLMGACVAMALRELLIWIWQGRIVDRQLQLNEASLRESEERFRIMADSAPVLIWMSGPDKGCTFFNRGWLEFTGRAMEQEIGDGWSEGVYPDDLGECLKAYVTAFDARKPFVLKYRLRRHDGEYRWVTDQGLPRYDTAGDFAGYIGACVDVTDLLLKDKALRELEERVTLAAEAAHLGVWELDTRTNGFWMSDQARSLFQFEPGTQVSYAMFRERVHPEDRALRDAAVKMAMETAEGYEIEYRTLLPDRTVRWIAARARCQRDENGKSSRLLGVSMDVTARRLAEEEARCRSAEISRLSRISLLGEMAASISHELKQPLSGIINTASVGQLFIDRGEVDPEKLREILADVVADGWRAQAVIHNIRDTIRKGTAVRRQINLNDVVMNVSRMMQPDAQVHSCEVKMSLAKDLPPMEGDPIQIQQVLINLVSNAFDAMREMPASRRKVEVTTERTEDGAVSVSVRDYGIGIAEETRERLFEQFFTTKVEGLGMGLAIVSSIIEAHAGTIAAENLGEGGARFHFILPASNGSLN